MSTAVTLNMFLNLSAKVEGLLMLVLTTTLFSDLRELKVSLNWETVMGMGLQHRRAGRSHTSAYQQS